MTLWGTQAAFPNLKLTDLFTDDGAQRQLIRFTLISASMPQLIRSITTMVRALKIS
jgi:hypothetical protein